MVDECRRRGIRDELPREIRQATKWAARAVAEKGTRKSCVKCKACTSAFLQCSQCDQAYCRPCLSVVDGGLWDLNFSCPACMIESEKWPEEDSYVKAMLTLAESTLNTMGSALRSSTWLAYHRCIGQLLEFGRTTRRVVFPINDLHSANSLAMFLEHLRSCGFSWAKITHFRSAIRNLCRAGGLPDPWVAFPFLHGVCEGIKKRSPGKPQRKEGLSANMVRILLEFWEKSEKIYRAAGQHRLADTVLRHQVTVIMGFVGMRRKSEIFLSADGRLGLRIRHVSVVPGSHVRIFVAAMKNDPYDFGDDVVLAWVTNSGIKVGVTICRYLARLRQDGVRVDAPLVCPTHYEKGVYAGFVAPVAGKMFMPDDCLPKGLKLCFREFRESPDFAKRFTWHSLRRGGATAAFNAGAGMKGVMSVGLWRSERGVAPYALAGFDVKLQTTKCM